MRYRHPAWLCDTKLMLAGELFHICCPRPTTFIYGHWPEPWSLHQRKHSNLEFIDYEWSHQRGQELFLSFQVRYVWSCVFRKPFSFDGVFHFAWRRFWNTIWILTGRDPCGLAWQWINTHLKLELMVFEASLLGLTWFVRHHISKTELDHSLQMKTLSWIKLSKAWQ